MLRKGSGGVAIGSSGPVYMECKHSTTYFTTPNVKFPMCIGQTHQVMFFFKLFAFFYFSRKRWKGFEKWNEYY